MNRLVDIIKLIQQLDKALQQKKAISQVNNGYQIVYFYGISNDLYNESLKAINQFEHQYNLPKFLVYPQNYWGNADTLTAKRNKIYEIFTEWNKSIGYCVPALLDIACCSFNICSAIALFLIISASFSLAI